MRRIDLVVPSLGQFDSGGLRLVRVGDGVAGHTCRFVGSRGDHAGVRQFDLFATDDECFLNSVRDCRAAILVLRQIGEGVAPRDPFGGFTDLHSGGGVHRQHCLLHGLVVRVEDHGDAGRTYAVLVIVVDPDLSHGDLGRFVLVGVGDGIGRTVLHNAHVVSMVIVTGSHNNLVPVTVRVAANNFLHIIDGILAQVRPCVSPVVALAQGHRIACRCIDILFLCLGRRHSVKLRCDLGPLPIAVVVILPDLPDGDRLRIGVSVCNGIDHHIHFLLVSAFADGLFLRPGAHALEDPARGQCGLLPAVGHRHAFDIRRHSEHIAGPVLRSVFISLQRDDAVCTNLIVDIVVGLEGHIKMIRNTLAAGPVLLDLNVDHVRLVDVIDLSLALSILLAQRNTGAAVFAVVFGLGGFRRAVLALRACGCHHIVLRFAGIAVDVRDFFLLSHGVRAERQVLPGRSACVHDFNPMHCLAQILTVQRVVVHVCILHGHQVDGIVRLGGVIRFALHVVNFDLLGDSQAAGPVGVLYGQAVLIPVVLHGRGQRARGFVRGHRHRHILGRGVVSPAILHERAGLLFRFAVGDTLRIHGLSRYGLGDGVKVSARSGVGDLAELGKLVRLGLHSGAGRGHRRTIDSLQRELEFFILVVAGRVGVAGDRLGHLGLSGGFTVLVGDGQFLVRGLGIGNLSLQLLGGRVLRHLHLNGLRRGVVGPAVLHERAGLLFRFAVGDTLRIHGISRYGLSDGVKVSARSGVGDLTELGKLVRLGLHSDVGRGHRRTIDSLQRERKLLVRVVAGRGRIAGDKLLHFGLRRCDLVGIDEFRGSGLRHGHSRLEVILFRLVVPGHGHSHCLIRRIGHASDRVLGLGNLIGVSAGDAVTGDLVGSGLVILQRQLSIGRHHGCDVLVLRVLGRDARQREREGSVVLVALDGLLDRDLDVDLAVGQLGEIDLGGDSLVLLDFDRLTRGPAFRRAGFEGLAIQRTFCPSVDVTVAIGVHLILADSHCGPVVRLGQLHIVMVVFIRYKRAVGSGVGAAGQADIQLRRALSHFAVDQPLLGDRDAVLAGGVGIDQGGLRLFAVGLRRIAFCIGFFVVGHNLHGVFRLGDVVHEAHRADALLLGSGGLRLDLLVCAVSEEDVLSDRVLPDLQVLDRQRSGRLDSQILCSLRQRTIVGHIPGGVFIIYIGNSHVERAVPVLRVHRAGLALVGFSDLHAVHEHVLVDGQLAKVVLIQEANFAALQLFGSLEVRILIGILIVLPVGDVCIQNAMRSVQREFNNRIDRFRRVGRILHDAFLSDFLLSDLVDVVRLVTEVVNQSFIIRNTELESLEEVIQGRERDRSVGCVLHSHRHDISVIIRIYICASQRSSILVQERRVSVSSRGEDGTQRKLILVSFQGLVLQNLMGRNLSRALRLIVVCEA